MDPELYGGAQSLQRRGSYTLVMTVTTYNWDNVLYSNTRNIESVSIAIDLWV